MWANIFDLILKARVLGLQGDKLLACVPSCSHSWEIGESVFGWFESTIHTLWTLFHIVGCASCHPQWKEQMKYLLQVLPCKIQQTTELSGSICFPWALIHQMLFSCHLWVEPQKLSSRNPTVRRELWHLSLSAASLWVHAVAARTWTVESDGLDFKYQLGYSQAVWPWAHKARFLRLGFIIYKRQGGYKEIKYWKCFAQNLAHSRHSINISF